MMNARQKYLAWLRQTAPTVYVAALRKVTGKPRGLGGLRDNLVSQMSRPSTGFGFLGDDTPDLETITISPEAVNYADYVPDTLAPLSASDLTPVSPGTDLTAITGADVSNLPTVTLAPVDTSASSSGGGGIFSAITAAVAGITTATMASSQQSSLLKLNTQRASQGLPPVNAQGVPISAGLFPSSNPQIAALESRMAGVASSPLTWIAGLGILAFFVLRK